jgi:membrane protein
MATPVPGTRSGMTQRGQSRTTTADQDYRDDHDEVVDLRDGSPGSRDLPGVGAEKPTDIPAPGWKQIVKRAWQESKDDNVPMLAGGVAFFAFLSLFPAMIALVSIWGLVVTPAEAAAQAERLTEGFPPEASAIITGQLEQLGQEDTALGIGLVISILLALWSASGGTANLVKAVNLAYDEEETRGFVRLRALALALTLGAIVFLVVSVGLVAVVPAVLDSLGLGVVGTVLAQVARWGLLFVLASVALAVVYRVAPDRDDPRLRWVSLGALVATALWLLGSIGFSLYVSNFGSYNETYGAIAGVAILMLWLYLTAYIVLLGAEVNAETEKSDGARHDDRSRAADGQADGCGRERTT